MRKATREQTKNHNSRLVLKTIYENDHLSRADIARVTHLTRPTVSSIVAELINHGFVGETGQGPSAGGKRPTMLTITDDAYQLVCIDLGSQDFRGGVANLRGKIQGRVEFPRNGRSEAEALDLVYQLIDELLEQATAPVLGIGIGTPGLVNPEEGIIKQAVNLGWQDLHLRDLLATRYQIPIYIANDSHMAALAEYTFGDSRGRNNLILIKIGQGIGAGVVINGRPLYGDGFGAGEIGHLVVAEQGVQCSCGNYGCLETITSTRAILQQAQVIANSVPESVLAQADVVDWDKLVTAVTLNDAAAVALVTAAGAGLGAAVASLIGSFNIHHIVIAGRVHRFGDVFLQAVRQEAQRRVLPSMAADSKLSYSMLNSDIVMLGSSAMILKHELGII